MTELRRRIDQKIYDEAELERRWPGLIKTSAMAKMKITNSSTQCRAKPRSSARKFTDGNVIRDMMQGNSKLADIGRVEEYLATTPSLRASRDNATGPINSQW